VIEGPMEKANLDKAEEENTAGGSTHRPPLRRVWMLVQAAGLAAVVCSRPILLSVFPFGAA